MQSDHSGVCAFTSDSVDHTAKLAGMLAAQMPSAAIVHLHGELGTGKTEFARCILRSLGVKGTVSSPSYCLAMIHQACGLRLGHFDFYRCTDANEWLEAGLDEEFARLDLALVEWPRRQAGLPQPDIDVSITDRSARNARMFSMRARSARGSLWLSRALPCD